MARVLDIGDWRGDPEPLVKMRLLAFMFFPEDHRAREEFIAANEEEIRIINEGAKKDNLLISALERSKRYQTSKKEVMHAYIAGHVLMTIRAIAEHHGIHHATVNKAVSVVAADIARDSRRTYDGTTRVPCSTSAVRHAWGKFKHVSHLWAALLNMGPNDTRSLFHDKPNDIADHAYEVTGVFDFDWRRLLSIAEDMRRFGEEHRSRPSSGVDLPSSILDPDLSWRAPNDLEVPSISLCSFPLSERAIGDLRSYTSDHR